MIKRMMLTTCALSALAICSSPAFAQQAAADSESQATSPVDADQEGGLDDIVVTAEKRETRLQQTPVAITAFTAEQRDVRGISSVQDIANFTPGLVYTESADRMSMRGLTRLATSSTADSAVAIYHDDLYTTRSFLVGLSDLFVERVEVHRGPQGTLFGRNAIGGVINTVSKRPTDDWSGEVRLTLGNYERRRVEATLSGPVTDELRFRISGSRVKQDKGYFRNLATGTTEGGAPNDWYVNAMLEWTPTDRDTVWLNAYSYGWKNSSTGPGSVIGTPEVGPYDTDLRNFKTSSLTFNPNFGYSTLSGFAPGLPGGAPAGQALGPVPGSVVGIPRGTTGNPALDNIRHLSRSVPTSIDVRDAYSIGGIYTHSFDSVDVKYVGGYSQYALSLTGNVPSGGNSGITSYEIPLNPTGACALGYLGPCTPLTVRPRHRLEQDNKEKWMSHELTLSGTGDGPVEWIAGVYYFWGRYSSPTTVSLPDQPQIRSPAFALTALPGPPFVGTAATVPNPTGTAVYNDYAFKTRSLAAYGQIDWDVTDTVKLTAGLRYTRDKKSGLERSRVLAFSNILGAGDTSLTALTAENMGSALPAVDMTQLAIGYDVLHSSYAGVTCLPRLAADGAYERCLGGKSDAVTGTAGIQWAPDPDRLLYFRYSRGYKALGFNAGFFTASPLAAPEYLDDFEIGWKHTVGRNLQYNIAAYHYKYRDAQVQVVTNNGTVTNYVFYNIPDATLQGVEVQADWMPVPDLTLNFSYAFNDTSIESDCTLKAGVPSGACFVDLLDPLAKEQGAKPIATVGGNVVQSVKGNPLPQASRNRIALSATYRLALGPGSLTLSGSYVWRDRAYSAVFKRDYNLAPSWDQVDVRATWQSSDEHYTIVGYVRNLFDTVGYASAVDGTANYNGAASLSEQNSIYDLTPPRTYGVELRYKF